MPALVSSPGPLALLVCAVLLGGCATAPKQEQGIYDPLEPMNRRIYAFNDGFDRAIARPVARAYDKVVPGPISQGVTNFFNNLDDVVVLVNSVLQLKPGKFILTANRLVINTTVGLYGLIDVVGLMGGEKADEDFGQTLGYWGMGRGPYLVLPFLGPSNLRDTGGLVLDYYQYDPVSEIEPDRDRYATIVLGLVDTRASLLGATDLLDTAAVDPYTFTREAFTRRREQLIYDGKPPPEALPGAGTAEDDDFDPFSDEDDDLFADPPPEGTQ